MIIYQSNIKNFIEDIDRGTIAKKLADEIKRKLNRTTSESEYRSWENSLVRMQQVLNSNLLDQNIGVSIEYNLPRSSKRIDVVLSGFNEKNKNVLLIIEIKQWESAEKVIDREMVVKTFLAKTIRETPHPSYQAYSYGVLLRDFSEVVYNDKNILIETCGFLHNYDIDKNPDINDEHYKEFLEEAPLFYKQDVIKFRNYILSLIKRGDNGQLISAIDGGGIRPGKSIQDFLKATIEDNDVFTLIDEQKVYFEKVLSLIRKANIDKQKRVIIIPGGPGTGKTLVAIKLLARTINKFQSNSVYVCKSESLRNVYRKIIQENNYDKKYTNAVIDQMFLGSARFTNLIENQYDLAIVDEAQRLIDRMQWNPKGKGYDNQIREIICESLVSVFFIDEKQQVTFKDIGTIEEIKTQAKKEKINSENIHVLDPLTAQFRTSGADEYIKFVDNLLYGEDGFTPEFKERYDIKVFDDILEMEKAVLDKHKLGSSARILAGYCWDWKSKSNPSEFDIEIGDFKRQWNLQNDKHFMIRPESIEQVGCIHTSQGLESDYVGVIIGNDLKYEAGKIITDHKARAKTDKSLNGIGKLPEYEKLQKADELIKNTYRVLLTRAMKGCFIYCVDKELALYIKKLLAD